MQVVTLWYRPPNVLFGAKMVGHTSLTIREARFTKLPTMTDQMVSLFIFLWFTYTDYFVIDENHRYNERTTGYMK